MRRDKRQTIEGDPLGSFMAGFGLTLLVTDFGNVLVRPSTLSAMDRHFPGWRNPKAIKGRRKAQRMARQHAERGKRLLEQATFAISELAWVAEQELVEI